MVEVGEHDENPSAFRAKCVLHGHSDVVEGNKRSSGCRRLVHCCEVVQEYMREVVAYVGSFDSLGFDPLSSFNEDNGKTIVCTTSDGEAR